MPKSRVRDQDGNLLKVYHGTKSFGFTVFDRNKTVFEGPFYFTSDAETARSYSGERGIRAVSYPGGADMNRGSGNYAVYLNLQNPLEVNCRGGDWDAIPASRRLIEAYLSAFPDEHRGKTLDSPSIARYAEYAGYDGVILRNIQDNGGSIRYDATSDVYIAFSADQIKSADAVTYDDTGKVIPLSERFQMDHDDIRYSISEDFAETCEEIGIPPRCIEIFAEGDRLITQANFTMYSFMATIPRSAYENVKLNEAEVDQVFTVPLEWFMHNDPEVHIVDLKQFNRADFPFEKAHISPDYKWRSSNAEVPIYNYEDKAIWGLTARITRNMVQILKGEKK